MQREPRAGAGPPRELSKGATKGGGDAAYLQSLDSARSSVDSADESLIRASEYELMMNEMERRFIEGQKETDEDIISKLENENSDLQRQLRETNAELMVEAASRAEQDAAVADLGRQVAMLQEQLHNATSLLESAAGPDAVALLTAQNGRLHAENTADNLSKALASAQAEAANLRTQMGLQNSRQVQELKQGIQVLNQRCEQLSKEKEELVAENKRNLTKCKEESESRFGEQLRNINHQWKLSQERAEKEHKELIIKLEAELESLKSICDNTNLKEQIQGLLEDKQSLENVVSTLRTQLQQNHLDKGQLDALASEKDKSHLQELEDLRSTLARCNQETAELRSKQAILREENAKLYEKIEIMEDAEEALRHVQARARALEAECGRLHAEKEEAEAEAELLYSRWKTAEQEALRFKRLYSRNSNLKDVIVEEEEDVAENVQFKVENEVDAAEKGANKQKIRLEEVPTGQGALMSWVERCEMLAGRLRTAEANASRLATQMDHQEARARVLSEEKMALLQKNKELSEKVASLQRTSASVARSKLLMNQYELKIGQLENERGHLQKALAQLEAELTKAKASRVDNKDLESAAKDAIILEHSLKHAKQAQNLLQVKVLNLEELVATLEAGLSAVGSKLEESSAELVAAWAAASGHQEAASTFAAQLTACQERASRLEQRMAAALEADELALSLEHGLRDLVDELVNEVGDLKAALKAERLKTCKRPEVLQERINSAVLLEKLGQQKEQLKQAKEENSTSDGWVSCLEQQLSEMIEELECRKNSNADSTINKDEELCASGKLEAEVRELQARLAQAQLQCQSLMNEKKGLENELTILETTLQRKEHLMEEQRKLLQLQLSEKDLEVKKVHAEATAKEIELLLCRSRMPETMDCFTDNCGRLFEVKAALDEVHETAMAQLREQVATNESLNISELQMKHLQQLEDIKKQTDVQEIQLRENFAQKISQEVEAVLRNLQGAFDEKCLIKVQSCVQKDLEGEVQKLNASFQRQVLSLQEKHKQEIELLTCESQSKLEHFKKELETKKKNEKVEMLLKEDKERHNECLLKGFERSVCSQLDACFQEICEKWGEKCSKAALEGGQEVAAEVKAASIQLSSKYHQEMENLRQALKEANIKIQEQIKMEWEKSCEVTELQQVKDLLAELRSSGLAVSSLLDLRVALEQKHKQEMDELRAYFEQRCEKYTEDVISQRSLSRKISISSDEFHSGEFDQEKTKDCESFSEPPSLTRPDVRLIEAVEAEWREKFTRQEERHEQQIKQLAKDMQEAHQMEISQLLEASNTDERLRSEMPARINTFNCTREPEIEAPVEDILDHSKHVENEVERRVAEETKKISAQIDAEIAAIKEASIKEQLEMEKKHQETVAECIEQREKLIKELEEKFEAGLAELQGKHEKQISKLKAKHEKELNELEEDLNKNNIEAMELALKEMNAKFAENLEGVEKLLAQAHQKEVLKLQHTIDQQEESFVALLEDQAKRGAVSELEFERRLQQERLDTVSALSQHLQAMLAGQQEATEWPAEMEQLRQYLVTDANSQIDKLKEQHRKELEALRQQLIIEGSEAPLREQFLQQKQVLNRENELLRHLVSELVRYLGQLDEQLASFVETHALGSDTESNASEEERRLRLAPDLSALSEALDLSQLDADQMRADLDACLLRLRREVADIIGVSEASLVGTKQLDELKQLLAASEAKVANLEARLEGRAKDTISEGFGDDGAPLGLEVRLGRMEQLLEMVKAALQDEPHPSGPLLEQLTAEAQRLADEARREKDDLHMQIECADKQVRANRAFMDEQAAEREQERDEFARQLQQLKDVLKDRDRDKHEVVRLTKEVEFLEGLGRENTVQLQKAQASAADAAAHFKAANDKVLVLREVVKTLEGQLEDKSKSEAELKLQLSNLQSAFSQESLVLREQLDALKNDQSSIGLLDQISNLEEQLNDYKRKLEEKVSLETPAQAEMNLQLKSIEMTLEKRTKELERVHKRTELSDIAEGVTSPESTDRVRSPLSSLRRVQDKLQNHTRAEDAAFAHIKKLEFELASSRRSEESLQIERCELQKRVEDQLQQITSLQARLDQQRFQQSSIEEFQSSNVRQVQLRSAEQLENLKEKLAAKETEVKEVKCQLEKTKRVLAEQEALAVQRERELAEENQKLREMLEVTEEEASRRLSSSPSKHSSQLLNSLVAEKNAEIEELSLQVQVLRERLDSVHHTLETSDFNKEQLLETVHELRMASRETRSHSTMIKSGDQEVLRATAFEVETFDSTFVESVRPPSSFACSPLQKSLSGNEVSVESPPVQPEEEQLKLNIAALQHELDEKKAELIAQREENEQLKKELTSVSSRLDEYAQIIQNELSTNIQAEEASEASLDISIASENLQKIMARVQEGGIEVLSLSELAVYSKHTSGSLPETQSIATQTIRSSLTEATLLANLKRETAAAAEEAAQKEKALEEQIESMKTALKEKEKQISELDECYANEKKIATDARLALLKHGPDSFQYQSRIQGLNERVDFAERQLQQAKLDLDKERNRANTLESAVAGLETDNMLLKAEIEGESFRHKVTRRNLNALEAMISSKDKEILQRKEQFDQEVSRLQNLLQKQGSSKDQYPKIKIEETEETSSVQVDNQVVEVSQRVNHLHLRHLLAQLQEEREKNVQMHFKTVELQDMVSALKETEKRLLERHDRDKKDFDRHRAELEQRLTEARSCLIAEVVKLRQDLAAATSRNCQCDHEATLEAERRSWGVERGRLLTEAQILSHKVQEAEAALTQEKANYILERMKAQYKAAKDTSIVDHDKVEYLHGKCLQIESRRKSLSWQKRYLMMVVSSHQASLNAIRAHLPQAPQQSATSPLSRFKAAALVVVSIHRMQGIVKAHLKLYRVSSTIVLKRIHDALVDSQEPRMAPCAPALLPTPRVYHETPKTRNMPKRH